jgi:transcriptional regulator GlxA family with amidase domain
LDGYEHHRQLPITVGILIFDHVEILDVADPFEVFSVARLNEERQYIEPSPFRVILLGKNWSRSWQLAVNALFPM